ncbi:YdeI/OmpD-associated family protein [Spirosoma sp. KUDC1026]|nr:YdeI/OmpD-associated family protein [Spirosoma sp. KUDC1026]
MADQEIETFCPTNRQQWREWLNEHHATKQFIWLVYHKKNSAVTGITYSEAVEEALCFGWIDSTVKPIDAERYRQFFSRRKPVSTWSKVNKERIQRLVDNGLMTKAGFDSLDTARRNGSWTILDEVEALVLPADLADAFRTRPSAERYFSSLCRSDRRNLLQWLVLAKRPETRQKRIADLVEAADQNQKPKNFLWTKKRSTADEKETSQSATTDRS